MVASILTNSIIISKTCEMMSKHKGTLVHGGGASKANSLRKYDSNHLHFDMCVCSNNSGLK